jgi:two-component system response regulator DesR
MRLQLEPDITVVGQAEDGPRALDKIRELRPDVVVIDYEMPLMNGCEVIRCLRDTAQACPCVVLSLHDEAPVRQAALEAGAHAFVAKHEPTEWLLAAIRAAARPAADDAASA